MSDYDQAIADYDKAITLNPDFAVAYACRGAVYTLIEEREKAILDLEKALKLGLDPDPSLKQAVEELLEELRHK